MNTFIEIRVKLKNFIFRYGLWLERALRAVLAIVTMRGIIRYFGYADVLGQAWVVAALTVLCAFVSYATMALILTLFMLGEIFSLSLQGGLIVLAIMLITYAFSRVFLCRQYYHIVGIPVFYQLHLTFLLPTEAALFGEPVEIIPLIGGTAAAFYLRQLRDNATALIDGSDTVTPVSLLQRGLFGNQLFYLYLVSVIALFVVISIVRTLLIRQAGILSVVFGILTETVIMLAGYLMLDSRDRIPNLIICNLVSLAIGVISSYLILDLDYSRVEKVQFEDDEYHYYVVAVPKIKLTEGQKEVKKITSRRPKAAQERTASKHNTAGKG